MVIGHIKSDVAWQIFQDLTGWLPSPRIAKQLAGIAVIIEFLSDHRLRSYKMCISLRLIQNHRPPKMSLDPNVMGKSKVVSGETPLVILP